MTVLSKFVGSTLGWRLLTYNCYEVGHTWHPSCVRSSTDILIASFKESLRIYSSLYIITTLLRSTNVKKLNWKRLITDILRSTLFLTSNSFFFLFTLCGLRQGFGYFILPNLGFMNGFIASFISILIERKNRRGLLALYLTNLASEVGYRMLVNRNLVHPLAHGESLLFSVALSGYMILLKSRHLSKDVEAALRFVFAMPSDPTSELKFFGFPFNKLPSILQRTLGWIRHSFGKTPLCEHPHSCVSTSVESFLRNFPFAYIVSVALRLATSLPKLIKYPEMIPSAFFSRSALKMPIFVGLLPFLYSATRCLLRRLLGKDDTLVHGAAGFVAGGAMLAYPSTSISMYLFWKLVEVIYFKLADAKILPRWKHFDVLLYSFSTGFVLFAAVVEQHALRPAYWKFLLALTGTKFGLVNRRLIDSYGHDSSKNFRDQRFTFDPLYTTVNPKLLDF